ncbi:sugar transferase [Brachybacterium phenoliresistens]|uniref:sugar transferase n=1 Tax=Brachybacterium phenoliresistens TaxID=396014 RepID=UPI0031CF8E32
MGWVWEDAPARGAYTRTKRLADLVVSGGALLVLSPVFAGVAILVRAKLGRPVIFRQERPGMHGEVFEILKFRTMLDVDPGRGRVSDEDRMTPFGRRLRATSLDEIPELINVLRGEMSLVGPRPLRTKYLERYSAEQARRHDVPPGLTGLAQISGRNALTWDDRFDLDLEYVRTRSLATDVRILLATVPKVLGHHGIAQEGRATMDDFFGPRRIGRHELRPAPDRAGEDALSVVDRTTGAEVARCIVSGLSSGVLEVGIDVVPDTEDAETVRSRAAEMLLGIARERDAHGIRIDTSHDSPETVEFWITQGCRIDGDHVRRSVARTEAVAGR